MMKQFIAILMTAAMLYACNGNSQNQALKKAPEIQTAIKPGTVAASPQGYSMKAKVNGKEWIAASMMPPEAAGRIIGYFNNEYIGLPYSKEYVKVGKKITLGENESADIYFKNVSVATTIKGQMEITKVEGNWAEGIFYFSCTTNGTIKTVEVTNGFFRISIIKN